MQISKHAYADVQYPALLREIPVPPPHLYILGELPVGPAVAVVGSRKCTPYGEEATYRLAYDLAKAGLTIISGLALGIDGVAHRAALDAGGKTVAVMAGGLDSIYPSRHRTLAKEILATGGALVAEHPAGTPPLRPYFVARNRIIAGLAMATLVTEADTKSGSLTTAAFALEANRMVMAVPGNITSPRSVGPNNLIKRGALAVTDAVDVLSAFNFSSHEVESVPVAEGDADETRILALLAEGHRTTQALLEHSGLSAAELANLISLMEITGKIRGVGSGQWMARA